MKEALTTLAVAILLVGFAAIGIAHIFKPDYFIKHSGVRRGGDLLNRWNRVNFQIVGVSLLVLQSTFSTSFFEADGF